MNCWILTSGLMLQDMVTEGTTEVVTTEVEAIMVVAVDMAIAMEAVTILAAMPTLV